MAEIQFMTTDDNGITLVDIDDLNNYLSTFFDEFNYTESPSAQVLIVESSRQCLICLMDMESNTYASRNVGEARKTVPGEDTESLSDQQLIIENNLFPQCLKETKPNTSASVSTYVKKARKAVPEEDKEENYWSFRKKNNEATRRYRKEKKKELKEIFSKDEYLNKSFKYLKEKHKTFKMKYKRLVKRKKSMQTAISNIVEICNIDTMENVG